jgi:hypothetical protein
VFEALNESDFWSRYEYAEEEYTEPFLTPDMLLSIEAELGFRLPPSYVELAKIRNGGMPNRVCHRTANRTTWTHDHVAITGIFAIGRTKPSSLCGSCGSKFWVNEWGYPPIGVYFADCPSAGHDMLCLDYRECGPQGEPQVVHVDQEWNYAITFVAKNFESFILGLEHESAFLL